MVNVWIRGVVCGRPFDLLFLPAIQILSGLLDCYIESEPLSSVLPNPSDQFNVLSCKSSLNLKLPDSYPMDLG